jgi:hypothetical protein
MNYATFVLRIPAVMAACFILAGCTTKLHFNTPEMIPHYPQMSAPIPHRVALIVPEETRDMAYTIPLRRWCIGEAVPTHMAAALKSAFKDVTVADDGKIPADAERIIYCSLGAGTDMKFGMLVSSDKTATVELNCRVLDAARSTLWEGGILRSDTFNAGIVAQMLQLTAITSIFYSNVDVAGAEEAYAAMITAGSNSSMVLAVDQLMEKMIREGRSGICPGCSDATDWRKVVVKAKKPVRDDDW